MNQIRLYLFGSPRIERDGQPVSVDTRKAFAMLAYLALTEGPQSRDSLAALLWPDSDAVHAKAALRRTLSALNKATAGRVLNTDRRAVSFVPSDEVWVDVARVLVVDRTPGRSRARAHGGLPAMRSYPRKRRCHSTVTTF